MKELLKELCSAFGPSGCVDSVRDIIVKNLSDLNPTTDPLGAVTVRIANEGAPKLMISAHMDEVGLMATGITSDGCVKFGCVGGIDPLVLSSKRVVSENGVYGAILSKPIHLQSADERKTRTEIKDMYIFIGAKDKEEAKKLVSVGDYFAFDSEYVEFGDGFIKAKALDDRLGCAIMCTLAKNLAKVKEKIPYDLYFSFTDREELGYSGAFAAAERIKPDYAIVIESTAVADIYGVAPRSRVAALGGGGAISFADRATIYERDYMRFVTDILERENIKYQIKQYVSGGNDASHIQRSACGTKVLAISAPSRYIHSPSDVVSYSDITSMYDAVYAVITNKDLPFEQTEKEKI